ncbi:hypothetical protein [Streptomyces sp. CC77]|uniref:hypothetical protein n=1 Tax=Streptomyces sp. CC77 TaxID=1906739 RepID=UPI0008DD314E|nr:hypothetical protein [Streptomyces sp. CC77]OII68287.1 hypothetical protein BJP39_00575 [Streptomyces sp. CC77]
MNISTHGVSLAKATDRVAGLPLELQVQALGERAWVLARELDAANQELAARKDIELELVRLAFEVAVENEMLRDAVEALSVGFGLELVLTHPA